MKTLDKLGAKVISQLTIGSELGWPPDCTGFIYQPERPVNKANKETTPDIYMDKTDSE